MRILLAFAAVVPFAAAACTPCSCYDDGDPCTKDFCYGGECVHQRQVGALECSGRYSATVCDADGGTHDLSCPAACVENGANGTSGCYVKADGGISCGCTNFSGTETCNSGDRLCTSSRGLAFCHSGAQYQSTTAFSSVDTQNRPLMDT